MIHPEEATLIIKGWLERKSELYLSASMINFSVYAKCRVLAVTEGKIVLRCLADDAAMFSFAVEDPHLSLKYSELRDVAGKPGFENVPEGKELNSALVVTLPLRAIDSSAPLKVDAEQIILIEL